MSLKFFLWVLNWRKNKRKKLIESLENIDKNKVHIFKKRRELNKWYKKQFNEKIKTK